MPSPGPLQTVSCGAWASTAASSAWAPRLSSGSLPLPHLGDCTHDGQPPRTRTRRSRRGSRRSQVRAAREPALGEAGAARVAVVDEDRGQPGVRVQRGRDPADVPAVAGGDQRQHPDRRVLGRVRRARDVGRVDARRPRAASSGMVHQTALVRRRALGQVERLLAEHLAGRQPAQEATSPGASPRTAPKRQLAPRPTPARAARDRADVERAHRPGVRGPPGVAGVTRARRVVEVELGDDVGLALVHVDRAGVDAARGPTPRRRCRAPGRCRPRRSAPTLAGPAQRDVVGGPVGARSRTTRPAGGAAAGARRARRPAPARVGPEQREVGLGQRQLGRGRGQVRRQHVGVVRVEDRRPRPAAPNSASGWCTR